VFVYASYQAGKSAIHVHFVPVNTEQSEGDYDTCHKILNTLGCTNKGCLVMQTISQHTRVPITT